MLRHLTKIKSISPKSPFKHLKWKVLSTIILLFFSITSIFAQDRYVATTGSNAGANDCTTLGSPCQTIAYAITQANTGDQINVAAGTYTANNTVINKEVSIVGTGNGTNPTIDVIIDPANNSSTAFNIQASNVTIRNMRIQGAGYGIQISDVTVSDILLEDLAVTNHNNIGIFVQSQATGGIGIDNVTINNSTFSANGTGDPGNGDISFFKFNRNASLSNITVTDGTGHIGLQIRGWDNGSANPILRYASFLPAGSVALNNVSIEGSYKRLSSPTTIAGAPMYISGYSSDLDNISFTDVELTSVASDNTYLRACLYVSEMIATQNLNLGNTKFTLKGITPFAPTTNNGYIFNNTQVIYINATASPFYFELLLLDKNDFAQAFFIEDYILHGTDANYITDANPFSSLGGFVEFNTGHAYTTLNSFAIGLNTEPNIGRAVECVQDDFTIVIQKNGLNALGNSYDEYSLPFTVNKTLTFQTDAANYTETTIKDITMDGTGKTLTFEGNFGISEKLSMQDGDVVVPVGANFALRSTATNTALIFNASPINTVQGNVIAERYIPQSSTIPGFGGGGYDAQAYHLFSSPFSDATISQFGDDMSLVLNTAYNTAPEPAFVRPFPNFFQFEETNNNVITSAYYNAFISNYKVPTTPNLLPAKGYQANIATQQIIDLNGTLNNGTQSIGVTNSGGQGYNLIGNPYPSPISWTALYNLNNTLLSSEVQFDIPVSQYNGNFASYTASGVSNNGGTNEIASMQGFFVRANTAGTVNIDNSVRLTTDARFYKTAGIENTKQGLIRLAIEKGGMTDETTIYFQEGATPNYDNGFDAGKLHKMNSKFSTLYSYNENEEQTEYFSINGLGNFDKEQKLPLAMNIVVEGEYQISLRTLKYFHSSHEIYLYDSFTNTLHDLRQDGNYKFSAKAGTEIKRFVLLFKADASKDFFKNEKVVVYPNPTSNEFSYSLKTEREGKCSIRLFDATGKIIFEENKTKEGAFLEGTINLQNQPLGLYLLQVSDSEKTSTVRIVKE